MESQLEQMKPHLAVFLLWYNSVHRLRIPAQHLYRHMTCPWHFHPHYQDIVKPAAPSPTNLNPFSMRMTATPSPPQKYYINSLRSPSSVIDPKPLPLSSPSVQIITTKHHHHCVLTCVQCNDLVWNIKYRM